MRIVTAFAIGVAISLSVIQARLGLLDERTINLCGLAGFVGLLAGVFGGAYFLKP
jgi:hypothetical protein